MSSIISSCSLSICHICAARHSIKSSAFRIRHHWIDIEYDIHAPFDWIKWSFFLPHPLPPRLNWARIYRFIIYIRCAQYQIATHIFFIWIPSTSTQNENTANIFIFYFIELVCHMCVFDVLWSTHCTHEHECTCTKNVLRCIQMSTFRI